MAKQDEFKGLDLIEDADAQTSLVEGDFPIGTMMRLTVKKYLWAVTGAVGIDVPVSTWDDVHELIEDWVDLQDSLVDGFEDELAEVYDNAPSRSRGSRSQKTSGGKKDVLTVVRGKMFSLATEKGVHVAAKYPDYKEWSVKDVEDFIEELNEMPDKGEDADKTATSRVRRARTSRR